MPRNNRRGVLFACFALLSVLAACAPPPEVPPGTSVLRVETESGPRMVLVQVPDGPVKAVAVMFPGGDGRIGVSPDGSIGRIGNFLSRTRAQWVARGLMFAAVDAAPNRAGTRGDRVGPENRRAIEAIVATLRRRTTAPIWLLGTSAGAPAALAGAASLPVGAVRGAVVSSPVSVAGPRDSVFDVALERVKAPVLIQVHRDDGCAITPPDKAEPLKARLSGSRLVEIQTYEGGDSPRSGPCEAFSQHGFLGLERRVVDAAVDWILAH